MIFPDFNSRKENEKMDQKGRDLLIEWLYVITGNGRAFWKQYANNELYNLYVKHVEEHGQL